MPEAQAATPAVPVARAEPTRPRLRPGWTVVATKELADHFLSARFSVLLIVLGLATVSAVYAAAGLISQVAPAASTIDSVLLRIFTVPPTEQIPAFITLVGFLAPLLGIAFGFDAVNGERAQGTLPRLLSQPIHRDDVINGKFVAGLGVVGSILLAVVLLTTGVGVFRLGVLPSAGEVVRLLVWLVLTLVYVGLWQGLASLFSIAVRRSATSAFLALAVWLVLTLFLPLLTNPIASGFAGVNATPEEVAITEQTVARLSPQTLYVESTRVLLNPDEATTDALTLSQLAQLQLRFPEELSLAQSLLIVVPQIVVLVGITVAIFAGAYTTFMRQEVRA
jgi:ABC-2 type transport system permease protein